MLSMKVGKGLMRCCEILVQFVTILLRFFSKVCNEAVTKKYPGLQRGSYGVFVSL